MAPSLAPNRWDDDDSDSTPPSSPPVVTQRRKFDDEEDDSDVLESWEAAEDSEQEREKAKKAAEAKAKAEAEKKANHKGKAQRIEELREKNRMQKMKDEEDSSEEEEEDDAVRLAHMRESEKASDLQNAEELFGNIGISGRRGEAKPVTVQAGDDPNKTIDLSGLKIFGPNTATQWAKLRETLVPLLNQNGKKAGYPVFLQTFTKEIARDLNSEQIKKIASGLSTMSNEKMKEEKAAEKGGKKSKAAKTKSSLAANRHVAQSADVTNYYDDGLDE